MTALTPLLAPDADADAGGATNRAEARSNMFVMATLYSDQGFCPVRVRNMSHGGALIESGVIPPKDSRVRLCRGSLSVRGHIAWQDDKRAGIRFDAAVEVGNWLPSGNRPSHQQRVDEMVQAYRTTPADKAEPVVATTASRAETIRQVLDLRDTLNAVADELAGDTSIAMAHATALQKIDVAAQALDKLASRLAKPA